MSTDIMSIAKREHELATYLDKQPYMIEQDGITLKIAKNVFPSDFGITSSFFGNFILKQAPASPALDMGCGSGYFACLLKKIGCESVFGVDFNPDAVSCAKENIGFNPALNPITFIHSDLFDNLPPVKFKMIVFNFNYYPSNGTYGLNEDGGKQILERFFSQVVDYASDDVQIYIPYSHFVGPEHDPKHICADFGFNIETVTTVHNHTGEHCIYKVTKA